MLKYIVFTCLKKQRLCWAFKLLFYMFEKSYGYIGKEVVVVQEGPMFVRPSVDERWEVQNHLLISLVHAPLFMSNHRFHSWLEGRLVLSSSFAPSLWLIMYVKNWKFCQCEMHGLWKSFVMSCVISFHVFEFQLLEYMSLKSAWNMELWKVINLRKSIIKH
jgi:hypothetical protein